MIHKSRRYLENLSEPGMIERHTTSEIQNVNRTAATTDFRVSHSEKESVGHNTNTIHRRCERNKLRECGTCKKHFEKERENKTHLLA